jgi:hypothetical protein
VALTAAPVADEPDCSGRPSAAVSDRRVAELVDRFMRDSSINSRMLPDVIERALYENVVRLLLSGLATVLDSSRVSLLGHSIRLHLEAETDAQAALSSSASA